MSLLETVNQLLSRGEVVTPQKERIPITVVSQNDDVYISRSSAWGATNSVHLRKWYVAPADPSYGKDELLKILWKGKGVVKFVEGLNFIMESLLPKQSNLLPEQSKSITYFEVQFEKYLHHGRAEFNEVVGTRYIEEEKLIIEDEFFRKGFGLSDGQIVFPQEQKQVWRNMVINFYPHVDVARLVASLNAHTKNWSKEVHEEMRHVRLGFFDQYEIDRRTGVNIDSLREFLEERIKVQQIMDMHSRHYYGSSI